MSRILHLRKPLVSPIGAPEVPGITIRPFNGADPAGRSDDVHAWLALREAAFARLVAAGRPWTEADFDREFTAKPWWTDGRMLLAYTSDAGPRTIVGSSTLGRTGRPPHDYACVAWLMVRPEQRGRGIGRLLLSQVEQLAFVQGETSLALETHVDWHDAVRLYRAAGYA